MLVLQHVILRLKVLIRALLALVAVRMWKRENRARIRSSLC